MTLLELLSLLAPAVSDLDSDDITAALAYAEGKRPSCLPEEKQDEAQVLYAAWLLHNRISQGGGAPMTAKTLKEGDLSITYGDVNDALDPMGFLRRYNDLAKICALGGSITVGRRFPQKMLYD